MTSKHTTALLALVLAVLAALAGAAWFALRPASGGVHKRLVEPSAGGPAQDSVPATDQGPVVRLQSVVNEVPPEVPTTVAYALEVGLELVRARDLPKAENAPALGTGATCRLKGSIFDDKGAGVRAEVSFAYGANEGRVLYCDGQGKFGANDLYPGISVVRVRGEGIAGSMREVLLRRERDSLLNIGYGRLSAIEGDVVNADGKGLADAKVTLDGQVMHTDETGLFRFSGVASGATFLTIEKPGFSALRESVTIVAGQRIERGRLKYGLQPGARLSVELADILNREKEALVYLLPGEGSVERKFPWHLVNPVRVWPGGVVTVEDLPTGPVTARLFHSGATAKPEKQQVNLVRGETQALTFHLEPAPVIVGVVTDGGQPVSNATVRLEMPDRAQAMLGALVKDNISYLYLESDVFPNLPVAVQETKTNVRGEFSLTAYEVVSAARYVIATSADGRRTASGIVRAGDTRLDLALAPMTSGEGEIIVAMPGRYQGLPVRVTVNGVPRELFVVPPGQDLHMQDLPAGTWNLTAKWWTLELLKRAPVVLDKEATLELRLPEGAIHGQDEATRNKARLR